MIKFTNVFKAFPKGGLALKDVSFHVGKGEFAFLTGHSGAGKSTVMKLIYAEERPTSGEVRLWGRVGSLLEVGTGFHPELTGRENIFLSGAILGIVLPVGTGDW